MTLAYLLTAEVEAPGRDNEKQEHRGQMAEQAGTFELRIVARSVGHHSDLPCKPDDATRAA
jgi:hypothetical protein